MEGFKIQNRAFKMLADARMKFLASCAAENINLLPAMYCWLMATHDHMIECTSRAFIAFSVMLSGKDPKGAMLQHMTPEQLEKTHADFEALMWLWKQDSHDE